MSDAIGSGVDRFDNPIERRPRELAPLQVSVSFAYMDSALQDQRPISPGLIVRQGQEMPWASLVSPIRFLRRIQ
jgi:hypothetical protein